MTVTTLEQRLARIESHRQRAEPLATGVAAYTSSTEFKVNTAGPAVPKARSWDHRFSQNCHLQNESPLKAAAKHPGQGPTRLISLGAARPAPEFYPWERLEMHASSVVRDSSSSSKSKSNGHGNGHSNNNGPSNSNSLVATAAVKGEADYDLSLALNYGYVGGSPQVLRFLTEHVELVHRPQYADWETTVTCGSTSALDMCFRIFCDPGDTVLMESHSYPGTIAAARAQGLEVLGIAMDDEGLDPVDLERQLLAWDGTALPGAKRPSVLYMIPTGQNPTGRTQSRERRQAIYDVALRQDLIIIEDDAYFYLKLGSLSSSSPSSSSPSPSSIQSYIDNLPCSYFSLDVDGRVVRLDSTSKILSPGLRLGWLTAAPSVVAKFLAYSEPSVLAPSGASQMLLYKLLEQDWGHAGFFRWLISLSAKYTARRDLLVDACARCLPAQACSWTVPESGMFLWVRVRVPAPQKEGEEEEEKRGAQALEQAIFARAQKMGVLISAGSWFVVDKTQRADSEALDLRLSFAAAQG